MRIWLVERSEARSSIADETRWRLQPDFSATACFKFTQSRERGEINKLDQEYRMDLGISSAYISIEKIITSIGYADVRASKTVSACLLSLHVIMS